VTLQYDQGSHVGAQNRQYRKKHGIAQSKETRVNTDPKNNKEIK